MDCPSEWGDASNVHFYAFGGAKPAELTAKLIELKANPKKPDLAVIPCMLNGLAKYSKNCMLARLTGATFAERERSS